MNIGFIGTGSMGKPMAKNILENGHELTVYNRTPSRTRDLEEDGAVSVETPSQAASERSVVVTMVSDDRALKDVVFGSETGSTDEGDGLLEGLSADGVHLAMSTISPETSRELQEAHTEHDQHFVAAPVFGKPNFSREGTLSVVAGGTEEIVERCEPVFDAVGRQYFTVAEEPDKANIVKLAGNFTIASMMETLGETFTLMRKADIKPEQFLQIINGSLFDSPLYEAYGSSMAKREYEAGFTLELGLKDMTLARETAQEHETPMPLLNLVHEHLLSGVARDLGEKDWTGIGAVIEGQAGLDADI